MKKTITNRKKKSRWDQEQSPNRAEKTKAGRASIGGSRFLKNEDQLIAGRKNHHKWDKSKTKKKG